MALSANFPYEDPRTLIDSTITVTADSVAMTIVTDAGIFSRVKPFDPTMTEADQLFAAVNTIRVTLGLDPIPPGD